MTAVHQIAQDIRLLHREMVAELQRIRLTLADTANLTPWRPILEASPIRLRLRQALRDRPFLRKAR